MAFNQFEGCAINIPEYDGDGRGNVAIKIGDDDWFLIGYPDNASGTGVLLHDMPQCSDYDYYTIILEVDVGVEVRYKYVSEVLGEIESSETNVTLEQTGPAPPIISHVSSPLDFTGPFPEPDIGTIELTTENINDGKITLNWEDIEGTS